MKKLPLNTCKWYNEETIGIHFLHIGQPGEERIACQNLRSKHRLSQQEISQ